MKIKITKEAISKILITVAVFWLADFIMHFTGVGESNYYYIIKFANSLLFAFIWFMIFNYKEFWKKILFSIIFGTWISFYYLISAYSGLVQWLGIYARYSAPPFMIFGIMLSSFFWWIYHIIVFYIGLEASKIIKK